MMTGKLDGVKWVDIKSIPTENAGRLQFFESRNDIDFDIKRIYYITDVPKGTWRGAHAHKELKQLLFCPYGSVTLKLTDGTNVEEFVLDKPNKGIVISKPTWRDMLWNVDNSVLCVAASDYYDVDDYIRDYEKFEIFVGVKKND